MEVIKAVVPEHFHDIQLSELKDLFEKNPYYWEWDKKENESVFNALGSLDCQVVPRSSCSLSKKQLCKSSFFASLPISSEGTARKVTISHYEYKADSIYTVEFSLNEDEMWYFSEEADGIILYVVQLSGEKRLILVESVNISRIATM